MRSEAWKSWPVVLGGQTIHFFAKATLSQQMEEKNTEIVSVGPNFRGLIRSLHTGKLTFPKQFMKDKRVSGFQCTEVCACVPLDTFSKLNLKPKGATQGV